MFIIVKPPELISEINVVEFFESIFLDLHYIILSVHIYEYSSRFYLVFYRHHL